MLIVYFRMTTALTYFALSLNSGSLAGDVFLNTFVMGVIETPANIISLFCMNMSLFGRRWTNALSLIIAGVASLIAVPLLITSGGEHAYTIC